MTKDELKDIISQIKKYNVVSVFKNTEEVDKWLSGLNEKQINNFISLNIEPNEIEFPKSLLIDTNLLNCDDYCNRVKAMSKIRNGEGCWHLFGALCSPNFLNSRNYYKDLEKISKADTARYALWVIDKDEFINSPYHDEDLELIVTAKDNSGNDEDWLVAEVLAMVAGNIESINSPYHRQDMKLIANSGSDCLQMSGSYPDSGINKLAINKVSLMDKCHLVNMKILSNNPIASEYLYNLMTDANIIKRKNYRYEVNALVNAKSVVKALAIYSYIANINIDDYGRYDYYNILYDAKIDYNSTFLLERDFPRVSGRLNSNYLKYLELLNTIDDKFVLFIEQLLSNKDLFESGYQEEDIKLLLNVNNEEIFKDLFRVMSDKNSLCGKHHIEDVKLISTSKNDVTRHLLLEKALNKCSIDSVNHRYDMEYITKVDWDNIDKSIYNKMRYYLFNKNGIESKDHVVILNQLYEGRNVDKNISILEYLDRLEEGFEEVIVQEKIDMNDNKNNNKGFARIRKLFGRR